MSPRLFVAVTAAALGLAGCAHEMSEQQRASAGPTTGSPSDPNAPNQAASIRPQSSPRTPAPASGTAAGAQAPALEPATEVPADQAGAAPAQPAAPAAPATPETSEPAAPAPAESPR